MTVFLNPKSFGDNEGKGQKSKSVQKENIPQFCHLCNITLLQIFFLST